jgi:multidrug resistance efflux pump
MEQLTKRYQQLNDRKIRSAANLDNAKQQLEAIKDELRRAYGTDDIAELRAKLDAMMADNEAKRQNYQAELDTIEGALAAIEQKVAATEDPNPNGSESK